jgi:Aldo/keto reductase family
MGMSGAYGPADEQESIATIHARLDRGVTLLDTGHYAAAHNELLIGRALRDRRDKALLSVKFGALRGPDASWLGVDARPAAVKNFLAYSLTRLGVDHTGIYLPGRLDSAVPSKTRSARSPRVFHTRFGLRADSNRELDRPGCHAIRYRDWLWLSSGDDVVGNRHGAFKRN